jgi:hypothetical protein
MRSGLLRFLAAFFTAKALPGREIFGGKWVSQIKRGLLVKPTARQQTAPRTSPVRVGLPSTVDHLSLAGTCLLRPVGRQGTVGIVGGFEVHAICHIAIGNVVRLAQL